MAAENGNFAHSGRDNLAYSKRPKSRHLVIKCDRLRNEYSNMGFLVFPASLLHLFISAEGKAFVFGLCLRSKDDRMHLWNLRLRPSWDRTILLGWNEFDRDTNLKTQLFQWKVISAVCWRKNRYYVYNRIKFNALPFQLICNGLNSCWRCQKVGLHAHSSNINWHWTEYMQYPIANEIWLRMRAAVATT